MFVLKKGAKLVFSLLLFKDKLHHYFLSSKRYRKKCIKCKLGISILLKVNYNQRFLKVEKLKEEEHPYLVNANHAVA